MDFNDILSLPPDQLDALRAVLNPNGVNDGRSPQHSKGVLASNPRQLLDLRKLPSATDPRPTFVWSAEESRDGQTQKPPYRRLMWAPDGREITIYSEKEERERIADGYVLTAPANAEEPDQQDAMRTMLEALSPEDRKLIVLSASKKRRARLEEQLAEMSDEAVDALLGSIEPKAQKKSA